MVSLTPRQIAVRGQETAAQLISALGREGLVARFLSSYTKEAKRPGRTANPERYRELFEAIRREALLVLVLTVESQIPSRLGVHGHSKAVPPESANVDLFHKEFFSALGRGLNWDEKEFGAFCRDLELYRKLYASSPKRPKTRNPNTSPSGPFVDRCGILMDPAMLDLARRAAAKFESELVSLVSARLKRIFSPRDSR